MIGLGDTVTWGENGKTVYTRKLVASDRFQEYLDRASEGDRREAVTILRERGIEKVVGWRHARTYEMCMSVKSPIGAALLGLDIGSRVQVETPAGTKYITVLNVERK